MFVCNLAVMALSRVFTQGGWFTGTRNVLEITRLRVLQRCFLSLDTAPESTTFSMGQPPDPNKHFYIACEDDVNKIHEATNDHDLVLIRGPPASGKSTIADAMRRKYPFNLNNCGEENQRSYVLLPGHVLSKEMQMWPRWHELSWFCW